MHAQARARLRAVRGAHVRLLRHAHRLGGRARPTPSGRSSRPTAPRSMTRTCSGASPATRRPPRPGRTRRYRHVLAAGLRGVAGELGFEPSTEESATFSGSVVDWPAFPDSATALARLKIAIPPRRDHQLRRRPVRGIERAAGRRLRLDRHGPAGPVVQARRAQLPGRVRAHRAASRAHPACRPEPVPRSRAGASAWASRRSGSIDARTARVRAPRPRPTPRRMPRSRTWRRSPRRPFRARADRARRDVRRRARARSVRRRACR